MTPPVEHDTISAVVAELRTDHPFASSRNEFAAVLAWADRLERIDAEMREQIETTRQQRAWRDLLTHKLIACGVAAHHPDPDLSKSGCYAGKWDSPQAQDVRNLRDERDELRAKLAACERERDWMRRNAPLAWDEK